MHTLVLLSVLGAPLPAAAQDTMLTVSVVRFYRAESRQTQVAAFIEADAVVGGSLQVRVTDAAGENLWEQQWPRVMPTPGSAGTTEHLRFTIGPGRHRLEVALRNGEGAVVARSSTPVEGFGPPPGASDLLLSPRIRSVARTEGMPEAEEFRRGDLLVTASARAVVAADLHYLLEAYNGDGGPATLTVLVQDAFGNTVREAPPAPVRVPVGVGVLSGALDLSTLPPGQYRLALRLIVDGRLLERGATFERR